MIENPRFVVMRAHDHAPVFVAETFARASEFVVDLLERYAMDEHLTPRGGLFIMQVTGEPHQSPGA